MGEKNQAKRCIYVDLSNLFGGLSEVFDEGVFIDFSTLMPLIDNAFGGVDMFKVYGSFRGINDAKASDIDRIKGQNEFMNSAKLKGVHFGKGYIRNGQEKTVDMQLGVDMVNDAHLGTYTDFILFAGDGDYSYPVSIVQKMGKYFHYCAFANRYSAFFAFKARNKLILDYNGLFAECVDPVKVPRRDITITDLYKDKSVKTKSIKIKQAKTPRSSRGAST